ncbi:hypothetical protein LWI29_009514 [Acer saccharum]|uniref:KIB1-4 beta-propeller domain-containing protein n=1 Tax=Acer saccharum TaxID=4024 RepID=A0AA39VX91_ACESA|nr:hypothetical protein LWI29_009514 [Acer saccharum]
MDMRRVKQHKAQVDQYQDWSRLSTNRCKQYKDQLEMPSSSGGLLWGCIKDWLIIVKPFTKFCMIRMSLLNPFTGSKVDLPSTSFHNIKERTDDVLIDLICFKGCFYLLTMEYNIRVLDAAYAYTAIQRQGYKEQIDTRFYEIEMSSDIPRESIRDLDVQIFLYLVEFGDEILLVIRFLRNCFEETYDFKVFRLDLRKKEWVKLDNLGDCVIFAGRNCSRCYSAKELGGGMGNCIYFTNGSGLLSEMNCENELSCSLENDDWGIFRLNNDGPERFSYLAKKREEASCLVNCTLVVVF